MSNFDHKSGHYKHQIHLNSKNHQHPNQNLITNIGERNPKTKQILRTKLHTLTISLSNKPKPSYTRCAKLLPHQTVLAATHKRRRESLHIGLSHRRLSDAKESRQTPPTKSVRCRPRAAELGTIAEAGFTPNLAIDGRRGEESGYGPFRGGFGDISESEARLLFRSLFGFLL